MKLTKDEVRTLIERIGVTQVGLGRLLGLSDVTSRRWAINGATGLAAVLLHVIRQQKLTLRQLRRLGLHEGGHVTADEAEAGRRDR